MKPDASRWRWQLVAGLLTYSREKPDNARETTKQPEVHHRGRPSSTPPPTPVLLPATCCLPLLCAVAAPRAPRLIVTHPAAPQPAARLPLRSKAAGLGLATAAAFTLPPAPSRPLCTWANQLDHGLTVQDILQPSRSPRRGGLPPLRGELCIRRAAARARHTALVPLESGRARDAAPAMQVTLRAPRTGPRARLPEPRRARSCSLRPTCSFQSIACRRVLTTRALSALCVLSDPRQLVPACCPSRRPAFWGMVYTDG